MFDSITKTELRENCIYIYFIWIQQKFPRLETNIQNYSGQLRPPIEEINKNYIKCGIV